MLQRRDGEMVHNTHFTLMYLQHYSFYVIVFLLRGQESAGIVTCNGASPPTYTTHKVTLIMTRSPLYD